MLKNIMGKFLNSRADNLDSSGPISSIIELIRDLMVIYILAKSGADWWIFVDAKVLTRKFLMADGWTDGGRTHVGRWVITIAHWALRAQVG